MQPRLSKLVKKLNKEQYGRYLELIPNFKKEKAQKFTTIVLTIVSVIILAVFAINPTLSTIANLQKQLDDAKFVAEKLDIKINNLSTLQTKYETLKPDLPIIYASLPRKEEAALLTGQIQALAQENGLAVAIIQVTDFTESKSFSYFTFNVSMQGDYENLVGFLNKLVRMQRIVDLKDISITSPENSEDNLILSTRGIALFKK
jgi:type IV pilus assembly protein PilO